MTVAPKKNKNKSETQESIYTAAICNITATAMIKKNKANKLRSLDATAIILYIENLLMVKSRNNINMYSSNTHALYTSDQFDNSLNVKKTLKAPEVI